MKFAKLKNYLWFNLLGLSAWLHLVLLIRVAFISYDLTVNFDVLKPSIFGIWLLGVRDFFVILSIITLIFVFEYFLDYRWTNNFMRENKFYDIFLRISFFLYPFIFFGSFLIVYFSLRPQS